MANKVPYTQPAWEGSAFNCPHCSAYANQLWRDLYFYDEENYPSIKNAKICFCGHCGKYLIWHEWKMIFPEFYGVEPPNLDLELDVQRDYLEAASIIQKSPRGAAALLRLAIQKLCV